MPSKAELQSILTNDNKQFLRSFKEAENASRKAGKAVESHWQKANKKMGGIGAGHLGAIFGGAALLNAGRGIGNIAEEVNDLSEAVSLTTEDFQRFQAAVMESGGDSGTLTKAMGTLITTLEDARDGSVTARKKFTDLGFSLDEISTMQPKDALLKLADALHKSGNDGNTTAAVMELLGSKVALKLIPSLKGGSEAFLEVGNASTVMSDRTIKNIDRMGDSWDRLKKRIGGGIANLIFDTEEGFKNGGSFWKSLLDVAGIKEHKITTPALTQKEVQKKHQQKKEEEPTMMEEIVVTPGRRPGFWQTDRPTMTKRTGNEEVFGPNPDGSTKGGFAGFPGGYFPSQSGGVQSSGGLTTGGLTSGGGMDNAYGKIRKGDAARKKAAAEEAKKGKDPVANNTATLCEIFGKTGDRQ